MAFATLQVTEKWEEKVFYKSSLILKIIPQNERTLKKSNRYSRAVKQNTAPGTQTGAKENYQAVPIQGSDLAERLHSNTVSSIRPLSTDAGGLANIARTEQNSAVQRNGGEG